MRAGAVGWTAEWAVAVRRPRLLLLDVLIPAALVLPLALADPPPAHEAAVLAVLFVLFGVFGSAIPLVRDGASGLLLRFVQAGAGERPLLAGRLAAQGVLDALQLAPGALVFLAAAGAPPARWAAFAGALIVSLPVANAVGAWAAAAARSLAEAALFSAVAALLLLHASGVFRTPAPGSPWATIERWSPFRLLHETLLAAAGGAGPGSDAGALVACGAILLGTWVAAPFLTHLLVRSRA